MSETHHETLWRGFPKTLLEFEERFGTEVACREYLAACRWNGRPRCGRCDSDHVWSERGGTLYECAQCGHQTSLTSGTLFHGTRKPLRLWFRAIWEICVHRHGISAADLQRILGLGSYETAWAWAHRIRRAMVRENRDGLQGSVQVDETYVGGKKRDKATVLAAAEEGGRLRLIHAPDPCAGSMRRAITRTASSMSPRIQSRRMPRSRRMVMPPTMHARWRREITTSKCKAQPKRKSMIMSSFATGRQPASNVGYSAPITAASATSICSPTSTSMPFAIIAEKPRASAASSHAVLKTCSQDNRSPCANSFKTPTNAEHSKVSPIEPD